MRPGRRRWLAAAAGALAGGRAAAADRSAPRLRVVASFSILADMVRTLAGDEATVDSLVGPDSDAHVFEPTPVHARRVAEADLVVVNGLGFEGWMPRLIAASGYRGSVVVASASIAPRQSGGFSDPHVWQDLAQGTRMAANLAQALLRARPTAAQAIERRHASYAAALAALDRTIRDRFDRIPRGQRRIVTSHDAFAYFGAAYGLDILAPLPTNNESEPSAATVGRLIAQLKSQAVRAVFIENIADPRLVDRMARDAGVTVGGKLYSDALSRPEGDAGTYLALVEHNARTILAALGH